MRLLPRSYTRPCARARVPVRLKVACSCTTHSVHLLQTGRGRMRFTCCFMLGPQSSYASIWMIPFPLYCQALISQPRSHLTATLSSHCHARICHLSATLASQFPLISLPHSHLTTTLSSHCHAGISQSRSCLTATFSSHCHAFNILSRSQFIHNA